MSNKSGCSPQAVTLPSGGGALQGIGETFTPDPFMGTGQTRVPLQLPAGRNGHQPSLSLSYSTGNGGGPFGLGWTLSVPSIARKTARGVPRYHDASSDDTDADTFLLAGSEDLVLVSRSGGVTRYRPRTEGGFSRIERTRDGGSDTWRVATRDGLVSAFGLAGAAAPGTDAAVVADPAAPDRVFAWLLTESVDPFGNRIEYRYRRDRGSEGAWDQLYLDTVRYADFEDGGATRFLVSVAFVYEDRPDPFSEYRAGFEIRTRLRCTRIETRTHAGADRLVRTYDLVYVDERVRRGELPAAHLPRNGLSLLSEVRVIGHDEGATEAMPPLEFGYTGFAPERRTFRAIEAVGGPLPADSLADGGLEMVGLFGNGLPDIVQLDGAPRVWRNLGGGQFAGAEPLPQVPAGVRLRDPGVQLADMNGDGRADLLVLARQGYFPQSFLGDWSAEAFVRYSESPAVTFDDAELRLIDLDGDGVVDALRTGVDLELFLNDPRRGWALPTLVPRTAVDRFPDVRFSDPRVKLADVNGDNLQDLVLVEQGRIDYWPYLGHGRWGSRITMADSPAFQDFVPLPGGAFDPRRVMFGDLDGDGLDDIAYIEPGRMTFWINRSGQGWSAPLVIEGTPDFPSTDAVRLSDVLGTGFQGVLWTADQAGAPGHYRFLDLTGGIKPYVLDRMDNHLGKVTRIGYTSSTEFYRADLGDPRTRWKAPLPFPIQVVQRTEVIDEISGGKITSEYRYHHGYWDGVERELRGFGRVDRLDTESFADYHASGLHGAGKPFAPVPRDRFSPPVLTRTWFHLGDTGPAADTRDEIDYGDEFWPLDPPALPRPAQTRALLAALPGAARGSALRALRGSMLRTEVFALDGSPSETRPFTVTERQYGLREESPPAADRPRRRIFFPHLVAERTTQWERGDDPMTRFSFTGDHDAFGQPRLTVALAVPRGRDYRRPAPSGAPYLGTVTVVDRAVRDDDRRFIVDRTAATTTFEILDDGSLPILDLLDRVVDGNAARRIVGQTIHHYDGEAFAGLPFGRLGDFGAVVRSESLVLTEDLLGELCRDGEGTTALPTYLRPGRDPQWPAEYPAAFRDAMPPLAGYVFADGTDHRARGFFATASFAFDAQVPGLPGRGLIVATRDALGADTTVSYDRPFHLLPVRVTDPAGLVVEVAHDRRLLRPQLLTDPNGNRRSVTYTPLGLVATASIMGRPGDADGDTAATPGGRFDYDLLAFHERRTPASVRSTVRQHHATATGISPAERDATVVTVEYSDGFGRILQTRTQADDELFGDETFGGAVLPDDEGAVTARVDGRARPAGAAPHVVVSGMQVFDNKGQPIERFEPYFATGFDFEAPSAAQRGRRDSLFYDPRGELIRTVHADGSEHRVVQGVPDDLADPTRFRPSAWETYTYDANDLAPISRGPGGGPLGGRVPEAHHFTPSSSEVDALGRVVLTVARAGRAPADAIQVRTTYDIRGNALTVTDPLDRVAFRTGYDLANRPWRVQSLDAGVRRTVIDALGRVAEQRDSKGALVLHGHDRLGRLTRLWARDDADRPVTLRQRVEFGDDGRADQPVAERNAMRARNLLGQAIRHHDDAGLTTIDAVDFKGQVLECSRRPIGDAPLLALFADGPRTGWAIPAFQVDWEPAPGGTLADRERDLLDAIVYRTTTEVDALGRIVRLRLPADAEGRRRDLRPSYTRGGALARVRLDDQVLVERIAYDAKGQRALILLGNGVLTRYAYDPRSCRLRRLRSERASRPGPATFQPQGAPIQDLTYEHDLVGNVVTVVDRCGGSGIINNPDAAGEADAALARLLAAGDALRRRFTYDPVYRLSSATGRGTDRPAAPPWDDSPRGEDLSRARGYTERYRFDAAGNLIEIAHRAGAAGFRRGLEVAAGGNRLQRVTTGGDRHEYVHDANGNVRRESTARHFDWTYGDQLRAFRTQVDGAEPSIYALYLYDAAGERARKLVRTQGGGVETTDYVGGAFEQHRWTGARTGTQTLTHVMDDAHRVAIVRAGDAHPDDGGPRVAVHHGDHVGSSHVVTDGDGRFVSREDLTPFGETTFGGFARKRFRFTGRERDAESGLTYHRARYYAPSLGRWASCDPAGSAGGLNLYAYAYGNPVSLSDRSGLEPESSEELYVGHEVIFVEGKKPQDVGDVQAGLGNAHVLTRDEFARGMKWTDLREDPNGVKRAEEYWKDRPDWEQAWQERVTREYKDYRTQVNADIYKGFGRAEAAYNVGEAIGWLTVTGVTAFAGGPAVASAARSAPAVSLGQWANTIVTSVMTSAPKYAVASAGVGALAPPGFDIPGNPFDDLGRWGRQLFSKVVRDLDGAPVLATRPDVQEHADTVIRFLLGRDPDARAVLQPWRPRYTNAYGNWTRRSIIQALRDARTLFQNGELPGEVQPAYDWLFQNFTRME